MKTASRACSFCSAVVEVLHALPADLLEGCNVMAVLDRDHHNHGRRFGGFEEILTLSSRLAPATGRRL